MFTIKFYSDDGCRQVIKSAESFTILRAPDMCSDAEITLHQKSQADDCRIDIVPAGTERLEGWPPTYQTAIIENALGKTTEIIKAGPALKMKTVPLKAQGDQKAA